MGNHQETKYSIGWHLAASSPSFNNIPSESHHVAKRMGYLALPMRDVAHAFKRCLQAAGLLVLLAGVAGCASTEQGAASAAPVQPHKGRAFPTPPGVLNWAPWGGNPPAI